MSKECEFTFKLKKGKRKENVKSVKTRGYYIYVVPQEVLIVTTPPSSKSKIIFLESNYYIYTRTK